MTTSGPSPPQAPRARATFLAPAWTISSAPSLAGELELLLVAGDRDDPGAECLPSCTAFEPDAADAEHGERLAGLEARDLDERVVGVPTASVRTASVGGLDRGRIG